MKISRTFFRFSTTALIVYFFLTFPFVAVATKNEYVRFVVTQTITHWKGKSLGVENIFIGDSLTAAGRNWGTPFKSVNLAGNGYVTWQITSQLNKTSAYKAENLFILAGTNDVVSSRAFNPAQFEADYTQLLERALKSKLKVIVTEIPFTIHEEHHQKIAKANDTIRKLALDKGVTCVDLNSIIAPNGLLLNEYSLDGVHLNPDAYTHWRSLLSEALGELDKNHKSG